MKPSNTNLNENFARERKLMVELQIKARGVHDSRVLSAMAKVPRHLFVPPHERHLSYEDYPLSIGHGQTISQPFIVALMTEMLELKGNEKVLDVGTGSGYQTAILAELVKEVYSIDVVESLAANARDLLATLGYKNIFVETADGFKGLAAHAPYDAILVSCAPTEIPKALCDQLAEGGRLVLPVGGFSHQQLVRVRKKNGKIITEPGVAVAFVPMIHG